MSQTVTQNSALSQNWVGCTRCTPWPSLRAQAAHPALRPTLSRCVVVVPRPCSSLWPTVSQSPSVVSWLCHCVHERAAARRVVSPLSRIVALSLGARARCCAPCRSTLHAVSPGVSRHTPAAKPLPSCHDTIICIVTRFANQTSRLSRYKDCIVTQPPATRPLSPVTIQNFVS